MLRRAAPLGVVVLFAACSLRSPSSDEPDFHEDGSEIGSVGSALEAADPVSAAVTVACSTTVVKGLATQLVEEIQCLRPGTFASIDGVPGLSLGEAVFPWLQTPAQAALIAVQKERGVTLALNSALRTLPQQYLLYRWYKMGRCNIGLAAAPGKSNHEEGLAVDVQDNAAWRDAMKLHDFVWLGASDPVHFDYKGAGAEDIGGVSVLAFQRLWNKNHPDDVIDEDGKYGPATEKRLASSPVGGFALGADCAGMDGDASAPRPPVVISDDAGSDQPDPEPEREVIPLLPPDESGCAMGGRASAPGGAAVLVAASLLALGARRRRRG